MSVKPLYYTFCQYVQPSESSFTIENPNNKARDGVRRSYHMGYLEVVPEYISEVAQTEHMDEPDVNPNEIILQNSLEMRVHAGYPPKDPIMGMRYTGKAQNSTEIYRIFNLNMETNKPQDYLYPPVIIDWTAPEFSNLEHDGEKFRAHLDRIAQSLYDIHSDHVLEPIQATTITAAPEATAAEPEVAAEPTTEATAAAAPEAAAPEAAVAAEPEAAAAEPTEDAPPPSKKTKREAQEPTDAGAVGAPPPPAASDPGVPPAPPEFHVEDHKGNLPPSVTTGPFNDYALPTDEDWHESVRMRITLRPGFKIVMSNERLLQKWGFTEATYGKRGKNKQFSIVNQTKKPMVFLAESSPSLDITFEREFKMSVYHIPENKSYTFPITTSAAELKQPETLVKKLQSIMKGAFTPTFGYTFDCTTFYKKTVFKLVQNGQIEFRIKLADRLAKILGFDPKKEITGSENESPRPYSHDATRHLTTTEGLNNAELLVLDTGPLNVTATNVPSITNLGHEYELIACLVGSRYKMIMEKDIRPEMEFPQKERELTFLIERNSDRSKKIGLSWTVGAYINGVLIGERV